MKVDEMEGLKGKRGAVTEEDQHITKKNKSEVVEKEDDPEWPMPFTSCPLITGPTSDKERLKSRIRALKCKAIPVIGDGNCQFRGSSLMMYGEEDGHKFVREKVVEELKAHQETYEPFVKLASVLSYAEYVERMSRDHVWGDYNTLHATANAFGVRIGLITSHVDDFAIEYIPRDNKYREDFLMTFCDHPQTAHYFPMYHERGRLPPRHKRRGKKTVEN